MTAEEKYNKVIEDLKIGQKISFREAIDQKCSDCMCYQREEVRECIDDDCILYYFKTLNKKEPEMPTVEATTIDSIEK